MTKICLVIPIHNALFHTKKCIKTILKNFDFSLGEVILIDDCSSPKTADFLNKITQKNPSKLKLIRNKENKGWLLNCNQTAERTNAEIVVFLNSDTEISEDFCSKIINCFNSDKNIMVASPISSNSATYYIPQFLPKRIMNYFISKTKPQYPDINNAEGFCFCVRNSFIKENGLFDTAYGLGYCEEVDFCYKVINSGYKCVLIDNLYVLHKRHKSFGKNRAKLLSENNKIFYKKWKNHINKLELNSKNRFSIEIIINNDFGVLAKIPKFIMKLNRFLTANRLFTLKKLLTLKKYDFSKKNKVIYTCISGDYDIIPLIQTYYEKEANYICFTDNKTLIKMKNFGMWQIRPMVYNALDNTRNARWHKTHPHVLFPDYEESIWIDANINILTNQLFGAIQYNTMQYNTILIPEHYCRDCVYDEIQVVKASKKDDEKIVNEYEKILKQTAFPKNYGLNETNIIYRKHNNDNVKKLMNEWWSIIKEHSKRDQLSLSYVLWKNNITPSDISIDNARIDIQNFKMYLHPTKNGIIRKILKIIFK